MHFAHTHTQMQYMYLFHEDFIHRTKNMQSSILLAVVPLLWRDLQDGDAECQHRIQRSFSLGAGLDQETLGGDQGRHKVLKYILREEGKKWWKRQRRGVYASCWFMTPQRHMYVYDKHRPRQMQSVSFNDTVYTCTGTAMCAGLLRVVIVPA